MFSVMTDQLNPVEQQKAVWPDLSAEKMFL